MLALGILVVIRMVIPRRRSWPVALLLTIIEAYGDLFSRTFAIPGIGHWAVTGFGEDLFAVGVLAGIGTCAAIRLRRYPAAPRSRREGGDIS